MFGEYDSKSDTKPKRAEEYFWRASCECEWMTFDFACGSSILPLKANIAMRKSLNALGFFFLFLWDCVRSNGIKGTNDLCLDWWGVKEHWGWNKDLQAAIWVKRLKFRNWALRYEWGPQSWNISFCAEFWDFNYLSAHLQPLPKNAMM